MYDEIDYNMKRKRVVLYRGRADCDWWIRSLSPKTYTQHNLNMTMIIKSAI